ncbi:MAG: hypothetical protein SFU53_10550 [Terrimicrobiaceae bacterium]|nr:hypothetical protein [Terrimicrobiaceae bacterium]
MVASRVSPGGVRDGPVAFSKNFAEEYRLAWSGRLRFSCLWIGPDGMSRWQFVLPARLESARARILAGRHRLGRIAADLGFTPGGFRAVPGAI